MCTVIAGYLSPMNDVTVSGYCYMTIDHHTPTVNRIKTLDLKSFSRLMVTTRQDATTTLEGDNLDVRSGALVRYIYIFIYIYIYIYIYICMYVCM